jgi:hypothetical protein
MKGMKNCSPGLGLSVLGRSPFGDWLSSEPEQEEHEGTKGMKKTAKGNGNCNGNSSRGRTRTNADNGKCNSNRL